MLDELARKIIIDRLENIEYELDLCLYRFLKVFNIKLSEIRDREEYGISVSRREQKDSETIRKS